MAYYALFAGILATGALNMLHVRGGFFTNHAADGRKTFIQRIIGQTPEFAALDTRPPAVQP